MAEMKRRGEEKLRVAGSTAGPADSAKSYFDPAK